MLFSLIKIIDQYIFFGLLRKIYKKITSNKTIKVYNTKTGKFYLPKYAYKDIIRNQIINNKIFDYEVFELSLKYIRENSIVLDAGANYGQLSILFSKIQKNVNDFGCKFKDFENFIYEINYKIIKEINSNYLIVPK